MVKNISRYFAFVIIVLTSSAMLYAEGALTNGFEFLNTDYNARSSAMGRSFLTMRGDISGMFVNPAGMAYTENKQYAFNYTNYLLDVNAGFAGYAHILPKFGILSVGLIYMDYGSFKETDEYAVETGQTFNAGDIPGESSAHNIDTDGDLIPDQVEDANGNGECDGDETCAWNPDTLPEQLAMIGLGVDGISTNRPNILMEHLKQEQV